MPYSEWTKVLGDADSQFNLDTNVKFGVSSLWLYTETSGALGMVVHDLAFSRGFIQSLVRSSAGTGRVGIGCLQQGVLTSSLGYQLQLLIGGGTNLELRKTSLAAISGGTALADIGAGFTPVVNTWYPLRLEWERDSITGNVTLRGYTGVATDFSDLTLKTTVVDSSSPLGATFDVSALGAHAGTGIANYLLWDQTSYGELE